MAKVLCQNRKKTTKKTQKKKEEESNMKNNIQFASPTNTDVQRFNIDGSSSILRAEFDNLTNTLKVFFRSGGVYAYPDAPSSVYDGLKESASAGKYFASNIRGKYDHMKLA